MFAISLRALLIKLCRSMAITCRTMNKVSQLYIR
jgi:hypothetical protein